MADNKFTYKDYEDNAETLAAKEKRESLATTKPGEFTYDDYVQSDTVTNAYNQLQQLQKPGEYQSNWQQSIDDTLNKILNREKFTYDLNGDMLYQQYKDQYVNQGKMAMMDTMGQAQAATGGYGNSYAQSVGQQAYQGYLQQLNDKVPELYQLALDKYNQEGQELYNQYGLFADRENTDYGRYRDTVSDYNTERGYLTDVYNNERSWDYGLYSDNYNRAYNQHRDSISDWQYDYSTADSEYWNQRNFGYGTYSDNKDLAYNEHRNAIADDQWQKSYDLDERQVKLAEDQASKASSGGSGSGGGGGEGNYQLTADEWNDISSRCDEYIMNEDATGLKNYLQGLYNRGYITADEYADFYEKFVPKAGGGGGNGAHSFQALTAKEARLSPTAR